MILPFKQETICFLNGYDSILRDLICGVPQGSSLGPLLFLLHINDFRSCLIHKSESGHFADDTHCLAVNKLGTIESVGNYELRLVSKWLRLNKLSLNVGKSKLIFFHSKQHSLDYENISIKFNGIMLKRDADNRKFL